MFHSPKRKYIPDNNTIEEPHSESNSKEIEIKDEDFENNLNEVEEYELEFDDEKYLLKTGYSKDKDSIFLKIKPLDNKNIDNKNIVIFYEGLFSSTDLTKLCKSFRMYDSIEEIFSAFCVIFENKKAYLKQNNENENEKDDTSLNLVIVVGSATGKEDEICLSLKKKEIKVVVEEKKEENNNINDNTNNNMNNNTSGSQVQCNCALKEKEINLRIEKIEKDLRNENYELKNEIFYLKDDINRYKKIIDGNKKDIKNLKTQIKDLKSLLEEKIRTLTDKVNSTNVINTTSVNTNINTNISNDNNTSNKKDNTNYDSNLNINKELKENNKMEIPVKSNVPSSNSKKNINQLSKKNTVQNKTNNKLSLINSTAKYTKNLEKKINTKREQYQQMKAAYTAKYNNQNKDKGSFGEFLRQKKSLAAGKVNQSLEIKEPINDNKDKDKEKNNKVFHKNNTNFVPENTKVKVSQSVVINKNKFEIKDDEKEKEYENEKENEIDNDEENGHKIENENDVENEDNYKDYVEEENLNINDNINNDYEDEEKHESRNVKEDTDLCRLKTYDLNRGEKIDQWKFDFDLNVKKLLEDNESKLKLAEKINKMNRRIINNVEELQLIENQLLKNYPDTKDIEYNLIYRGSEDGDKAEIFHEKCDNTSFTLTVIKNTDGNKFGGYTEEGWEGENTSKKDFNSFCFSLTKNKIYTVKPDKSAIICDPNLGPSFGSPLFHILDEYFTNGGMCYPKDKCGYSGQDSDFEICNGQEEFEIQEIEIYKINFN